ncbi:MAG: hypothetical protein CMH57_00495, partial [Myxococcales bacterium]|nr:hypothetical protein [Myxococcales bacterium]
DLVKYLEMMPRSLDWSGDLDDDDLDCVWESIAETRTGRGGARSAQQIWEEAKGDLPEGWRGPLEEAFSVVDAHIATLEEQRAAIEAGAAIDQGRLNEALFGVGRRLRALREG